MNDFDYDVKQKKALIPSARKRVNGSKSKRCTLPSDHLTPAQRKKLNGPVCTYSLNQPMKWQQFKDMPEDLQEEYIRNLRERYTVSQTELGRMFGVSTRTVVKHIAKRGYSNLFTSKRMNSDERFAWRQFCTGVAGTEDTQPEELTAEPEQEEVPVVGYLDAVLQSGALQLQGDGECISAAIAQLLAGREAEVSIAFRFTNKKEEIA